MNNLELKRVKIEKLVGIPLLLIAGFVVAPFIFVAIKGLIGLAFAVLAILAGNYAAPAVARAAANLRIKAIQKVAALDPIGTLDSIYVERKEGLLKHRESIRRQMAIKTQISRQIGEYEERFKKPSPRRKQFETLSQLIAIGSAKYEKACVEMEKFELFLEEQRADWEVQKSLLEASQLARAGQGFYDQVAQSEALRTIQMGLDTAFAEVDASVMDARIEQVISGKITDVSVAPEVVEQPKQVNLVAPRSRALSLEFDSPAVTINRK